jgi:hypothetical protein
MRIMIMLESDNERSRPETKGKMFSLNRNERTD